MRGGVHRLIRTRARLSARVQKSAQQKSGCRPITHPLPARKKLARSSGLAHQGAERMCESAVSIARRKVGRSALHRSCANGTLREAVHRERDGVQRDCGRPPVVVRAVLVVQTPQRLALRTQLFAIRRVKAWEFASEGRTPLSVRQKSWTCMNFLLPMSERRQERTTLYP
jgi:hypothetical protein